jgi:hypothetical protein
VKRDELLSAFFASCRGRMFDWRTFNCTHFAAAWVRMAEPGLLPEEWPEPASALAAARLIKERGGLAAWVTDVLRRDPIPMAFATTGDLVMMPGATVGLLGVCNGRLVGAMSDEHSLQFIPMPAEGLAWAVAR